MTKPIEKILLINPPMVVDTAPTFPSMGIAYITMALRNNGYEVDLLDVDAHRYSKEIVRQRLEKFDYDIIGIGGLVTVWPYLTWLVPEIRKIRPDVKIILGGAVASSLKGKCFENLDIDFSVIGEGEVTIIELLNKLNNEGDFSDVLGIGYKLNGTPIFTNPRPLMESLDQVPLIDYSLFPIEQLLENAKGVMQVHAQRGCPNSCTFCFNCYRVISRKVRYRPPTNVVDEIEVLKNTFKIDLFAISGECITMNRKWLNDFCQEIINRELNIRYRVTSRVDTIDDEKLRMLRGSGCVSIAFGLESGSNKILKIMKKNSTAEQGLQAVTLAKKYMDQIEASFIMGYVGENEETLAETVRFCKSLGVMPYMFYVTPYPGTELYEMALDMGRITNEDEYLNQLDHSSIFASKDLNLTEMTDGVAKQKIKSAVLEIRRYYLRRKILNSQIFVRIASVIRENGIRGLISSAKALVNRYFRA